MPSHCSCGWEALPQRAVEAPCLAWPPFLCPFRCTFCISTIQAQPRIRQIDTSSSPALPFSSGFPFGSRASSTRLPASYGNISEVPLFVNSKATRMIQFADLVAFAIRNYYERGIARYMDLIKHRFDSEGGVVHGLVHFVPAGVG